MGQEKQQKKEADDYSVDVEISLKITANNKKNTLVASECSTKLPFGLYGDFKYELGSKIESFLNDYFLSNAISVVEAEVENQFSKKEEKFESE